MFVSPSNRNVRYQTQPGVQVPYGAPKNGVLPGQYPAQGVPQLGSSVGASVSYQQYNPTQQARYSFQQPSQQQLMLSPPGRPQSPPHVRSTQSTQNIVPSYQSGKPQESVESKVREIADKDFKNNGPQAESVMRALSNLRVPPNMIIESVVRPTSVTRTGCVQHGVVYQPIQQIVRKTYEQPLQVVDLRQFEDQWKTKIQELEEQLRNGKPIIKESAPQIIEKEKIVYKEDLDRVNQLTAKCGEKDEEIKKLKSRITQLENDSGNQAYYERLIKELEDHVEDGKKTIADQKADLHDLHNENDNLRRMIKDLENEIGNLRKLLQEKDGNLAMLQANLQKEIQDKAELEKENVGLRDDCDQKEQEIQDLLRQLEEFQQQSESTTMTTTRLESDVNTWRSKFIEINREFHTQQEELMLVNAELEQLKKAGQQKIISSTTETIRKSGVKRSVISSGDRGSEYEKSQLNPKDMERINQLSQN